MPGPSGLDSREKDHNEARGDRVILLVISTFYLLVMMEDAEVDQIIELD
jgi:hypothetical protein